MIKENSKENNKPWGLFYLLADFMRTWLLTNSWHFPMVCVTALVIVLPTILEMYHQFLYMTIVILIAIKISYGWPGTYGKASVMQTKT